MFRVRVAIVPRSYRRAAAVAVALAVLAASVVDPAALTGESAGPPASTGLPADNAGHAVAYTVLASTLAYERLPRGAHSPRGPSRWYS